MRQEKHRHCPTADKLAPAYGPLLEQYTRTNWPLLKNFAAGRRRLNICFCQHYRMMIASTLIS